MTYIKNGTLIIAAEPHQQCDACGEIAELRPYGPNGKCICFECGQKDIDTTRSNFLKLLESQ